MGHIDLLKWKDTQVAKYEVFTVLEESHIFSNWTNKDTVHDDLPAKKWSMIDLNKMPSDILYFSIPIL